MPTTPINSIINLALPSSAPEIFTDSQVRAAVEMFLVSVNNLLREIERYGGITQKDITLWNSLLPSDTLLHHQLGRLYVTAFENLINGDIINLFLSGGILQARKANAAAGSVRPASGYCSTAAGILAGTKGEVILYQGIIAITGVTRGDHLFLAAAAGQATTVAPVGAGQLEQFLGIGVDTNVAYLNITGGPYIQH